MPIRKLTCIICPRGCSLSIDTSSMEVNGNSCIRGSIYAKEEITSPKRTLTTSIRVNNRDNTLVSVKTSSSIPKDKILLVLEEINKYSVSAPCHVGDILITNILSIGADIVITRNID